MINQLLAPNQKVRTERGVTATVGQFLGGGGQGEVYRADLDGLDVALKWYFPQTATAEQRTSLEELVRRGAPNDKFLWPIVVVNAPRTPGYGYLMKLRDKRFRGIVDLMKRRAEPSFYALTTACYELADSYRRLHNMGLCYRDISFGNVFFDPDNGEVLICDCDNVAVNGTVRGGVLGTPRFMAPEIVRGEARPDTNTDLFSLSVLLFCMLIVHHPLEGQREHAIKCLDLPAMKKLYGSEPLFIFDPNDSSNRPVPGYHDNATAYWPLYPEFLQKLFTQAFTDGLHDAEHGRVREGVWRDAMLRLRDAILYCSHCEAENFYGAARSVGQDKPTCWACNRPLVLPYRLRLGRQEVMLTHKTRLSPHHLDPAQAHSFSPALAEVARHPTNPDLWGLKNLGRATWQATLPDGSQREVETGRSVSLAAGTHINFGASAGEIVY